MTNPNATRSEGAWPDARHPEDGSIAGGPDSVRSFSRNLNQRRAFRESRVGEQRLEYSSASDIALRPAVVLGAHGVGVVVTVAEGPVVGPLAPVGIHVEVVRGVVGKWA